MPSKSIYGMGFLFIALTVAVAIFLELYQLNDISYFHGFDTMSYLDAAKQLATHHRFHPTRCIGYPIILLLAETISSNGPPFFYTMYVLQIIMYWFVVLLQYRWLKELINEGKAFYIVAIGLLNISFFVYAFFLLTEIPCLFFIALGFEQIRLFLLYKNNRQSFFSALFFSLAVLFKPGLLLFVLLLAVVFTVYAFFKKVAVASLLFFYLGVFLPISIQAIGMYNSYGRTTLSYIGDITHYRYFHTAIIARAQNNDVLSVMKQRDSLVLSIGDTSSSSFTYPQFASVVRKERNYLLLSNPIGFISTYGANLFSNFHTGNTIPQALPSRSETYTKNAHLFFTITRIWNMLFVIGLICGVFYSLSNLIIHRHNISVLLSVPSVYAIQLVFCLYAFLISGVSFYQGDRFNIIWIPFLLTSLLGLYRKRNSTKKNFTLS